MTALEIIASLDKAIDILMATAGSLNADLPKEKVRRAYRYLRDVLNVEVEAVLEPAALGVE